MKDSEYVDLNVEPFTMIGEDDSILLITKVELPRVLGRPVCMQGKRYLIDGGYKYECDSNVEITLDGLKYYIADLDD